MLLLTKAGGELQLSPPCRGIRIRLVGFQNPGKFWLWIWNPGLWNPEYNPINRHPANDWTCESKFHWQKIQNPVLSSAIPYSPSVHSLCLSIFLFLCLSFKSSISTPEPFSIAHDNGRKELSQSKSSGVEIVVSFPGTHMRTGVQVTTPCQWFVLGRVRHGSLHAVSEKTVRKTRKPLLNWNERNALKTKYKTILFWFLTKNDTVELC